MSEPKENGRGSDKMDLAEPQAPARETPADENAVRAERARQEGEGQEPVAPQAATIASPLARRPQERSLPAAREQEAEPRSRGGAIVVAPRRRRGLRWVLVLLLVLGGGGIGGGIYWWNLQQFHLPPGFASGNGRLEADPIDIDTKFAGRVAEILADEGDTVKPGQVVARMDTRDLEATLKKTIALKAQAQHSLEEARALVKQQEAQVLLARQEFDRTSALVKKGFATHELLDQRRQALDAALAALNAAKQRVDQAEHAVAAASADIALYRINIADNTLVAPKYGRIEYRIANVGEVLPAGGRVFTMIDLSYVYMDIYLPTREAGRAAVGDAARIVLDAFPHIAIPARVVYIATQAQFTPKAVETKHERDRLMFRVRARIDPGLLKRHSAQVRTGLPGMTYIRLDPKAKWPKPLSHEGLP